MGWRDRDYAQDTWSEPRTAGPSFRWPPRVAGVLIGLHLAAFVLIKVVESDGGPAVGSLLALSGAAAHPLGILLHPLATGDVFTLVINILVLWMLAGRLEQQFGRRQTLILYVAGNLLAGGVFFALARLWPLLASVSLDYPAGAFAAWCVLAFRAMPGRMVMLLGRPRRLSHLLAIALAATVGLMLALRGLGAVGWLLALVVGGCADPLVRRLPATLPARRRPRRVVRPSIPHEPAPPPPPAAEPDVDEILAKISRSGLDSLTDEERDRLEAARQAKLRRSHDLDPSR